MEIKNMKTSYFRPLEVARQKYTYGRICTNSYKNLLETPIN